MARLVLVHGSVANAEMTFGPALDALRERVEVALHTRSGYPPRRPEPAIDFETQAAELAGELRDGDHLAGHSYGGVVARLAAARTAARLASLAVSEPPAFRVALNDPAVRDMVAALDEFLRARPRAPRDYVAGFLALAGSSLSLPDPLPPPLEAGARAAMVERPPQQADIPLDALAAAPYPKLVISGAHSPAFDAVCDALARGLGAQRLVLPGAEHSIPRAPDYAEALTRFIEAAS